MVEGLWLFWNLRFCRLTWVSCLSSVFIVLACRFWAVRCSALRFCSSVRLSTLALISFFIIFECSLAAVRCSVVWFRGFRVSISVFFFTSSLIVVRCSFREVRCRVV